MSSVAKINSSGISLPKVSFEPHDLIKTILKIIHYIHDQFMLCFLPCHEKYFYNLTGHVFSNKTASEKEKLIRSLCQLLAEKPTDLMKLQEKLCSFQNKYPKNYLRILPQVSVIVLKHDCQTAIKMLAQQKSANHQSSVQRTKKNNSPPLSPPSEKRTRPRKAPQTGFRINVSFDKTFFIILSKLLEHNLSIEHGKQIAYLIDAKITLYDLAAQNIYKQIPKCTALAKLLASRKKITYLPPHSPTSKEKYRFLSSIHSPSKGGISLDSHNAMSTPKKTRPVRLPDTTTIGVGSSSSTSANLKSIQTPSKKSISLYSRNAMSTPKKTRPVRLPDTTTICVDGPSLISEKLKAIKAYIQFHALRKNETNNLNSYLSRLKDHLQQALTFNLETQDKLKEFRQRFKEDKSLI